MTFWKIWLFTESCIWRHFVQSKTGNKKQRVLSLHLHLLRFLKEVLNVCMYDVITSGGKSTERSVLKYKYSYITEISLNHLGHTRQGLRYPSYVVHHIPSKWSLLILFSLNYCSAQRSCCPPRTCHISGFSLSCLWSDRRSTNSWEIKLTWLVAQYEPQQN